VDRDTERIRPSRYNLRYLVTAHSKAPAQLREADKHRLIGAAMQTLKDHPVLDQKYLTGSLAEQQAEIHVVLEKATQDHMIKIWNNTSTPYKLSFIVVLTGVEIDSHRFRKISRVTDVARRRRQAPGRQVMIRIHADAVLHVKDGFSGLPVSTAGLLCRLDGAPCQPVRKQNGELVLIDLPEGPHCVTIECFGFQKEQLDLVTSPNVTQEVYVTLKPSENYPFRGDVTRLFLTVKEGQKAAPGRAVWLTAIGAPECKIAQTKAEAGAMEVRLFWKGPASRLGVPGQFLIDDGEDAEIVTVQRLKGENGVLAAPLKKPHGRGQLAATIMDNKFPSFGMCSCPANPSVAAATAAALGVLTPMPCVPATVAPWVPGCPTVLVGGKPLLNNSSKLMCAYGGIIQVTMTPALTVQCP